MFIILDQRDIKRFYTNLTDCELVEGPPLERPCIRINTDYIASLEERVDSRGDFDYTEVQVVTGKIYEVVERVSEIIEEMKN